MKEGTYVFIWQIHADIWQKLSHIVIFMQSKNKYILEKKKKKYLSYSIVFFLLEYSFFTMLCLFLLYNNYFIEIYC